MVSTRENEIERFTEKGIVTQDGVEREFDVVCLASGFDSVTGGITQIDIKGLNGETVAEKWKDGVYTFLGMVSHVKFFYFSVLFVCIAAQHYIPPLSSSKAATSPQQLIPS